MSDSASTPFESLIYRPAAPLSAYVDCMWYRRGCLPVRKREYAMPTGRADLVVNLQADRIRVFEHARDRVGIVSNGVIVHGAQSRAFVLDAVRRVHFVGVHFRPGGGCLFGLPSDHIADRHVSLELIWGARANRLRDRLLECGTAERMFALLEAELLRQAASAPLVRPAIAFARRTLRAGAEPERVEKLWRDSGYSERRFRTLFAGAFGLSPKVFLRVQRMRAALQQIARADQSLGSIAAANGYFDQAHMTRELREIAGVAPSTYAPMQRSPLHMEVD